ncbi:MAG: SpoIID/LytB domain-containing protein [Acidobacteriota bacterium]
MTILLATILILLAGSHAWARDQVVTVGLFQLFQPQLLQITPENSGRVFLEAPTGKSQRLLLRREILEVRIGEKGQLRVRILGEGSDFAATSVEMIPAQWKISIPGKIERLFSGGLTVSARNGGILPVLSLGAEAATLQILRSEMSAVREPEALKAQAILVRSYLGKPRHLDEGFDFCDTTHCQFLTGYSAEVDNFQHAVKRTRHLVLTYRGQAIAPLYTAVCGGRTLPRVNHHAEGLADYPYLSLACPFCAGHPLAHWKSQMKRSDLLDVLSLISTGLSAQDLLEQLANSEVDRPESTRLRDQVRLQVGRRHGWNVIRSNRYVVDASSDPIEITGWGSGHNSGLCQAGAVELARQGKSFLQILRFYFPGCSVQLE